MIMSKKKYEKKRKKGWKKSKGEKKNKKEKKKRKKRDYFRVKELKIEKKKRKKEKNESNKRKKKKDQKNSDLDEVISTDFQSFLREKKSFNERKENPTKEMNQIKQKRKRSKKFFFQEGNKISKKKNFYLTLMRRFQLTFIFSWSCKSILSN